MKRRLFTCVAAVSLVLCVELIVLWIFSHSGQAFCVYPAGQRDLTLRVREGKISFYDYDRPSLIESPSPRSHRFVFETRISFLVAGTAVLPALWALLWWRRRPLRRQGACPICGYDLRASTTRCPECGTAVGAEPT